MMDKLTPAQLAQILTAVPDPVWVLDADGRGIATNAAGQALAGNQSELAADHPLLGAADAEQRISYSNADAREFHFLLIEQPLDGGLTARIYRDITEEVRLDNELQAQSLKDPITGLLNERGLLVALEPQVSRSRRYSNPLSVVALEIDMDPQDEDLRRKVGRILKDQLRWADLIGCSQRANSFIMVLPETEQDDAMRITEKLQAQLSESEAGRSLHTAYGVVQWKKSDNAQTLLTRAEEALQEALGQELAGAAVAM